MTQSPDDDLDFSGGLADVRPRITLGALPTVRHRDNLGQAHILWQGRRYVVAPDGEVTRLGREGATRIDGALALELRRAAGVRS